MRVLTGRSFGKAFCESLSTSVCSTNPCDNCPNSIARSLIPAVDSAKPDDVTDALTFFNNLPCCGDSRLCGSSNCGAPTNPFEDQLGDVLLPRSVPPGLRTRETDIPCNDAWTMLKEHPNIAFASTVPPLSFSPADTSRFAVAGGRGGEAHSMRRGERHRRRDRASQTAYRRARRRDGRAQIS